MTKRYKFVKNVPAGLFSDENWENSVPAHSYLGKIGILIENYDSGYDTDRPTGYETVFALIEFEDGKRFWIPYSTYVGFDLETNKDQFVKHLERV